MIPAIGPLALFIIPLGFLSYFFSPEKGQRQAGADIVAGAATVLHRGGRMRGRYRSHGKSDVAGGTHRVDGDCRSINEWHAFLLLSAFPHITCPPTVTVTATVTVNFSFSHTLTFFFFFFFFFAVRTKGR